MKKKIFILSLIPCLQALFFNFTFDDFPRFVENSRAKSVQNLLQFFTRPTWPGNLYRPIEELSYSLSYKLFGLNPLFYHLENIILNIAVCLSIFILLRKLFSDQHAFLVTALFSLHPLHAEVISNVSYRTESACALFTILALISALKSQNVRWLIFYALSFFLALLSKESGIHVLLLLPLVLFFSKEKPKLSRLIIASLLALIAYLALRYNALDGTLFIHKAVKPHDNPLVKLSFVSRVLNAVILLSRYACLSIFPYHVSAVSSFPKILPVLSIFKLSFEQVLNISTLVALVILSFRNKNIRFYFLWFLFSLAITSNIAFPIGTIFADRLCYLASLMGSGVMIELISNSKIRAAILLFAAILLCLNISYWKNNYILFKHESQQSARASIAHRIYGKELLVNNENQEAIKHLKIAKTLYPYCLRSPQLLSLAYLELGNYDLARQMAKDYLKHNQKSTLMRDSLRCSKEGLLNKLSDYCNNFIKTFREKI